MEEKKGVAGEGSVCRFEVHKRNSVIPPLCHDLPLLLLSCDATTVRVFFRNDSIRKDAEGGSRRELGLWG